MLNGVYLVVFQSSLATMGEAIVVFDACGVHGANENHVLRGRQEEGEDLRLLLLVEACHLHGEKYPSFGPRSAVKLELEVTVVTEDGFRATGTIIEANGIRLNVVAKKLSELAGVES
ncbi:MAG: hypothetical protein P4L39_00820 [Humidesulfovibrio sp.]|nr:hypothetical protein [Humidesulfovibrio sp.]